MIVNWDLTRHRQEFAEASVIEEPGRVPGQPDSIKIPCANSYASGSCSISVRVGSVSSATMPSSSSKVRIGRNCCSRGGLYIPAVRMLGKSPPLLRHAVQRLVASAVRRGQWCHRRWDRSCRVRRPRCDGRLGRDVLLRRHPRRLWTELLLQERCVLPFFLTCTIASRDRVCAKLI